MAVQSDKANDKVANFVVQYKVRSKLFVTQVVAVILFGNEKNLDSPEFDFMSEDLYILPPSLNPCELVI